LHTSERKKARVFQHNLTLLIPPVSIILGALVLDETLSPNVYAGLALLALGLVILDGRLFKRR